MARELNFATGLVDYTINGGAHVRFNPADIAFTERFYDTFIQLDSQQDEFQRRIDEIGDDKAEFFAYARERDEEMRKLIDSLFGENIADEIFGEMSTYAVADGMPLWVNFLFAIAEEIRNAYDEEKRKQDPRLKQFDSKHEELLAKYRKATTKR